MASPSKFAMNIPPVKIPERTSSLLADTHIGRIRELEEKATNLKRKASALSTGSQDSSAAWIEAQIALHTAKFDLYTATAAALRDSFGTKTMKATELKEIVQEVSRKRLKAATSMTNLTAYRSQWLEKLDAKDQIQLQAYQAALINNFRMNNVERVQERSHSQHKGWRKSLEVWQNSTNLRIVPGQRKPIKETWCPVLKRYSAVGEQRIAAHIIPHYMGFESVAWQLGNEGNYLAGYNHIWDLGNGIMLSKSIEDRFDRGEMVIVPTAPAADPQNLQLLVLDTSLLQEPIPEIPEKTFGDFDGQALVFKGDGRPRLRYLYWHYVTSILRMLKYRKELDIKTRFPGGRMWPSAGSYLRRSTLKPLAKFIGDYDLKDDDFSEGSFSGAGRRPEEVENAIAADMADLVESHEKFAFDNSLKEESGEEEDEESSDDDSDVEDVAA